MDFTDITTRHYSGFDTFVVDETMNISYRPTPPQTYYYDIPKCGVRPVSAFIKFYADYIITIFGSVSNFLVVAVLLYSKILLPSVSGVFLLSLTISDTMVLLTNYIDNLTRAPIESQMIWLPEFSCMGLAVLKYASRFAATTIVLAISINRFIVVMWPLRSHRIRRPRCAVIQVAVIGVVSVIVSLYGLGIGTTTCGCKSVVDETVYTYGVTAVDVVFCDLLAGVIIWVLSCWTIHVFRMSGSVLTDRHDSMVTDTRKQGERHMTVLLLTVAVTFVLLRLPYTVVWTPLWFLKIAGADYDPSKRPLMQNLRLASHIMYIFSLLNHAINLYLYCLCSKGFREEFVCMVKCAPRNSRDRHPSLVNMKMTGTTNTSPGRSRSNSNIAVNVV